MAVLAWPALEGAVTALLVALGIGVGTAVVSDEVKRRQRATSDAGTGDAAKSAPAARTKSCQKCPPDCGILVERNWNMSAEARAYQAKVTGFTPGTEWGWGGLDFDGFASAGCMLKEAKSRYDQFLTQGQDAELQPKTWYASFRTKMIPQAQRQAAVAAGSPPASLTWYFQGPFTFEYMAPQVMRFPPLVAVYVP